jgi:spermidine/putrescine transport system permease protein
MTKRPKTPRMMIWYGELSSWQRLARRGFAYLSPGVLWLLGLLLLPGLALVAVGFVSRGPYGGIHWSFTLENYQRLLGYGIFGWSPDNWLILWRSVVVAFVTTIVSILLSYPVAFFIATRSERKRYFWLTIVIVPLWTNMVIRAYAWFLILAPGAPLARLAALLGLITKGASLYPSEFAVYLGMVAMFLPFIILPLYASVERLDWSLVEAARDLYGSPVRVFMQAILPQTAPGLTAGVILTFVPAMGMFVVPDLLGGSKFMLVGNLIEQQFGASRDWPYGAAISMALMVLTLISLQIYLKKAGSGPKKKMDLL